MFLFEIDRKNIFTGMHIFDILHLFPCRQSTAPLRGEVMSNVNCDYVGMDISPVQNINNNIRNQVCVQTLHKLLWLGESGHSSSFLKVCYILLWTSYWESLPLWQFSCLVITFDEFCCNLLTLPLTKFKKSSNFWKLTSSICDSLFSAYLLEYVNTE